MDVILHTPRLTLRPFSEDDFATCHAYASSPENVKYMVWGPNTEEQTREFLRTTIEQNAKEPRKDYDFAVVLNETGRHIGGCGIYLSSAERGRGEGMLGWILHRDYWRRGICVEAARALMAYGFGELGLHRVYATCNADNYGSYRVMEKLGMRREAHFVKNRYGRVGDSDIWYDEYHYAMLRDEWENAEKINNAV